MTAQVYRERDTFSAGVLALLVHAAFFSVLYLGVNWQTHRPEVMVVEMWDALPEVQKIEAPQSLPEPEKTEAPKPVVESVDIALKEKKLKQAKQEAETLAKKKRDEQDQKRKLTEQVRLRKEIEDQENETKRLRQEARLNAEQNRLRSEVSAGEQSEIDRYSEMIRDKIKRNLVMPPDVPKGVEAKFSVRLLPGGDVLDVVLRKSSGSASYDNAAERAIYKAKPLPVPQQAELARRFRELELTVKP
jgi:colicin import membrane protein